MTSPRPPSTGRPSRANAAYAWHDITTAAHTPEQLACLRYAGAVADEVTAALADMAGHDPADLPPLRHGTIWCQTAVTTYLDHIRRGSFADHGAGRSAAQAATCRADGAAIRAWLTSLPAAGDQRDGAGWRGWGEDVHLDDPDLNSQLSDLFEHAQRAGVFGVPGRVVEVWHVTDAEGRADGHLLVLRSLDDTGLASCHIPDDLLLDDNLAGLDAAVCVLENAATYVDELLQPSRPAIGADARAVAAASFAAPATAAVAAAAGQGSAAAAARPGPAGPGQHRRAVR